MTDQSRTFVFERCGGPGRLEFSQQLSEVTALERGAQIRCSHLELHANLINVFDCTLALRYAGAEEWNYYSVPDQRCASEAELFTAIRQVESKFRLQRGEGGQARIWIQPYAGHGAAVEFKVNRCLGLVLGMEPERVYSGVVPAEPDVHALVRHLNVSSSLVSPSLSVNASTVASLGTFQLHFNAMHGEWTDISFGNTEG